MDEENNKDTFDPESLKLKSIEDYRYGCFEAKKEETPEGVVIKLIANLQAWYFRVLNDLEPEELKELSDQQFKSNCITLITNKTISFSEKMKRLLSYEEILSKATDRIYLKKAGSKFHISGAYYG